MVSVQMSREGGGMKPLTPFDRWMVQSNLDNSVKEIGLEATVALLRARGYDRVADEVERQGKGALDAPKGER